MFLGKACLYTSNDVKDYLFNQCGDGRASLRIPI